MTRFGVCSRTKERVDSYEVCWNCKPTTGEYILGRPISCDDFIEDKALVDKIKALAKTPFLNIKDSTARKDAASEVYFTGKYVAHHDVMAMIMEEDEDD